MATTDAIAGEVRMIPLDRIRHDSNIREHDQGEIDALAGSIELLGQITPAIVRPDGDGYVLVADGKAVTRALFSMSGTYVLRATANDGELSTTSDITVNVNPSHQ